MHPTPLLRLPPEILDAVLSLIDVHEDIVAFALASHACAAMAIPRHTEYRILRIRHSRPELWAHLAHRADLASSITHLHISDRYTCLQPDRMPRTLVDPHLERSPPEPEELRIRDICRAIKNMKSLKSFVWEFNLKPPHRPTILTEYEDAILDAVRQKRTLDYFALIGPFGFHAKSISFDPDSERYPLWRFCNLKRLNLFGDAWVKPTIAPHVFRLLQKMPHLEHLEIPLEFWYLHCCTFPALKALKLQLLTGASASLDSSRSLFIDRHATLEKLCWFPLGLPSLGSESLPNLKSLTTTRQVVECLASVAPPPPTPTSMTFATFQSLPSITEDPRESNASLPVPSATIQRPIECLDVRSLDAKSLLDFHRYFLDSSKLCKLRLHTFHDIEDVCQVGDVFTGITWLWLPSMHLPTGAIHPTRLQLDDLLMILSHFPRLEVLRGQALWTAARYNNDDMHLAIMDLVQILPNLRELDHSGFDDRRKGFKRIVLERVVEVLRMAKRSPAADGEEEDEDAENHGNSESGEYEEIEREHVTYAVAKPKARDIWDIFDGSFD